MKKKSILYIIFIGIILVLLIIFSINRFITKKETNVGSKPIVYDNYIYKIRFDFGTETYIYLLPDNVIKTVSISEIYDIIPDCKCYEPTGKYEYKEETIDFSDETKKSVINVFDDLYKMFGKNEFDAKSVEISKYQTRVLLAVILNEEDDITIESNIEYKTVNEEFTSNNNKIINSKVILNNNTNNKTVNIIANYLNNIVDRDFNYYNNMVKESLDTFSSDNLGVNLKVELAYVGPYSISFTYVTEGQLGTTIIYDIKGYTFKYTGDVQEFDMNGWKDDYYNKALDNFMKSDLYINNSDQLIKGWETVLYDNMFELGNWYLLDNKVQFLISGYLLGFDDATSKKIIIDIDIDEEF